MAEEEGAEGTAPEEVNLQELLETMLSKHNLVTDPFLSGNMNAQMYIPVAVLLQHPKLVTSGTAEGVLAAAEKSARLGVSEDKSMIRPMLKSKRNTVILRDMPEDATEEDIREIFSNHEEYKGWIKKVKPDINQTWFVKLDADEQTQDVVIWLRTQSVKGKKVNAAIKSEHFLRSFFPVHGVTPIDGQGAAAEGDWNMQPMMPTMGEVDHSGPQPQPGYWQTWGMRTELGLGAFLYGGSKGSAKGEYKGGGGGGWKSWNEDWSSMEPGEGGKGWANGKGKGGKSGKGKDGGKEPKRKKADSKGSKKGGEDGGRRRGKDGQVATPKVDDEESFPALGAALPGQGSKVVVQRGYKDENFKRYTREQIEGILTKIDFSSVEAPDSQFPEVILEEPCLEFQAEVKSATVSYKDKATAVA